MNSVSFRASRRTSLLYSVALSSVLWPLDAWSQSSTQTSQKLDPVVVTNPTPTVTPLPSNSTNDSRSARGGKKRAATAAATTTSATVPTTPAAPTLTLNQTAGSGSRLNLTRLETPASVEIINAETIAERGQHSVIDAVTQNATGFTASPAPGNGSLSFNTRGFTGNSTVMTLYDGTRLYVGAGTLTFPFDTWSAQRIEVLRGPASVMYGEGAIGGAINVISKMPLTVQRNEAEVSLDSNMTKRLAVDSGGPINKDVSYRVTAIGNMSDGWVERDKTSNVAVSAAVRVQASDTLSWTLSTDYGDRSPSRYFGTPVINGGIIESLRFKNYNVGDSNIRYQDSWNQLRTEWQVTDSITIHNALYYLNSQRHWRDVESYAWNPAKGTIDRSSYIEIFHNQQQVGDRMDATFRGHVLGLKNEFVAGFDVNRIDFTHTNNSPFSGTSSVNPWSFDPGVFLSPIPTVPSFNTVTNQYALFAEDRLSLTDQWTLIGGVRQDEPVINRTDLITPANGFVKSFSATSWRVGTVYNPVKDLALYGQYSTAVDPVGNLITLATTQKDFQLSTGKQAEIGIKQSFWQGRGEWTLAGYQIVKNNLLARDPNNPALTQQIGQQSSRGVEASIGLVLDHGWRIDANTAWLRAKYDDFVQSVNGVAVNFAGNVPVNVPQQVSNVWLTWAFAPNWSVNGGVQIVGKTFADNANTLAHPAYNVVNTGVQWKPDANTTLSLRVYNLFDKIYATSGGTTQWLLGMPRTAELALNVKF
ncbi:TonB-dependent siderophore receptor [Afipia sp. GAS231]|uniref:TonB-dependent receptor n=1 Tax=Afipia sp. GAS231 TaxID=1882747 RepID=UPI00087A0233|nr:TonB-dependent siderophore receptor [Afipia sp. GAS231]SDP23961.1 iron complex outermembrane recepter protein [Afipia sp. GAS231]